MNYKYRLLSKLIIIWIMASIYPVTNQLNHLTAYSINGKVLPIHTIIFYSTIAYLITLFMFWLINKFSLNNIGKKILLIIGSLPIILPFICYKTGDDLGVFIYMTLGALALISGIIVYIFQKLKPHFIKFLLIYLSQFLGLYLIIIAWQKVININFEIILFVGLPTLFLSNLFLLKDFRDINMIH